MTDREKLIELYREAHRKAHEHCNNTNCDECEYEDLGSNCIRILKADHLLANGVVVREKGEWEKASEYMPIYRCSICKERNLFKNGDNVFSNFCPNCGADMRKGENG